MRRLLISVFLVTVSAVQPQGVAVSADDRGPTSDGTILTGPATEKRFPPLVVPEGFRATLFACDPLIEYPSVVALGPGVGTLFVAHDYVTGLGVEIVRRDEVRLIKDTDGDGYADRSIVYAGGFNSIQGLAFFDGNVFVMHAPLLTRLRDTNGDSVADQRRDLITGLGLPPEENSNRLHCANGVVAGHDGWLYLALGDRGCDVQRPEGDRLLFQQGGILRCRFDGSDLHAFSSGLRNIYDVALDEELNVFVRDNENDGGDYMIRVCHCFFGSDHGYPYHYYERPAEAMTPLADLGRGSSAGGASYLENAFPDEYRDSLYFCEWGRAVVRYKQKRRSSSFAPMQEIDFAVGADTDPYGFKPTDLVVDYDGSIIVSDWCDGQRPKRGRGRIYRIEAIASQQAGPSETDGSVSERSSSQETGSLNEVIAELGTASHSRRVTAQLELQRRGRAGVVAVHSALNADQLNVHARLHAVWIIAGAAGPSVPEELFALAEFDPDSRVRAQAIRAIGDLSDPVLVNDRIDSRRGDGQIAERIAGLAENEEPRVVLEALTVLRRLQWSHAPEWIAGQLSHDDPALNHAASGSLRHVNNWPAVLKLLDASKRLRRLALHAIAEQRDPYLADELISRMHQAGNPQHRREYADALTRIVRKLEPWTYWGFRPAPRVPATVDWKRTAAIITALNESLADDDLPTREFVLERMLRENIEPETERLVNWLRDDRDEQRVSALLAALRTHSVETVKPLMRQSLLRTDLPVSNRLTALSMLLDLAKDDASLLTATAEELEDGPVLAALLNEFGRRPDVPADRLLLTKLESAQTDVRAAAIRSLGIRGNTSAASHVGRLLSDSETSVQLAAVEAAGLLETTDVSDTLLRLASSDDAAFVSGSLVTLRQLGDRRAVSSATAALASRHTQTEAIDYLRQFGGPRQLDQVVQAALSNPASDFQHRTADTLAAWHGRYADSRRAIEQATATVQGQSGQPLVWSVAGPMSVARADDLLESLHRGTSPRNDVTVERVVAREVPAQLSFDRESDSDNVWVAWTPVRVASTTNIEVLASATGSLSVWIDGQQIHTRTNPGSFRPDSDRVAASLNSGTNLVSARFGPADDETARFQFRFRRRSSKAEHERLIAYGLQSRGNANRGREVFANAEKSSCIRCHRLGAEGGRIGPDLTGIGSRFSRIHLIESILEPSRTVAPSYTTLTVIQNNGKVLSGIRVSETDDVLVLGDNQGKLHDIRKSEIEETATQPLSTMPEGLEKRLTDREFTDLLAFLESQKVPLGK